jgi:hypothetical protein
MSTHETAGSGRKRGGAVPGPIVFVEITAVGHKRKRILQTATTTKKILPISGQAKTRKGGAVGAAPRLID